MDAEQIKKELREAIVKGQHLKAGELAKEIIENKLEIAPILKESMVPAMDEVGVLFENHEYFIP